MIQEHVIKARYLRYNRYAMSTHEATRETIQYSTHNANQQHARCTSLIAAPFRAEVEVDEILAVCSRVQQQVRRARRRNLARATPPEVGDEAQVGVRAVRLELQQELENPSPTPVGQQADFTSQDAPCRFQTAFGSRWGGAEEEV
eukprot:3691138-Rhodomonas_salina.2